MKAGRFTLGCLAALLIFGTTATPSAAQDVDADWEWSSVSDTMTEPWRFSLIGYAWAPHAPASIKTNSAVVNLPESFDTIVGGLNLAAMAEVEVHKGPFGVFVSPVFYEGQDREGFTGALGEARSVKVEETVWLIDYGVSYDLGKARLGEDPDSPTMTLQTIAGVRYLHDDIKMDLNPGLADTGLRIRETIEFHTPIIGIDTEFDLTGGWRLRLGGDYGGFNVDNVNETYQILGAFGYAFPLWGHTAKVFAGYRYVHLDYEKELEIELTVKGPLIGFGFEF